MGHFTEPKQFWYEASESLTIKKLSADDKKNMHFAEQILRSTFRITIKELREFYDKHEIFALWYKDRMTSATILSVHPTISVVNVVFFATVGYLSNLHFGTVLDNFIKYYAIQRGCSSVIVTALDVSVEFWHKQGYTDLTVTEEFSQAYIAAGAVQLRNTVILNFRPDQAAVMPALKKAAVDADNFLLERAEKSARSTIALRVLARHGGQVRSSRRQCLSVRHPTDAKDTASQSDGGTGKTESTRERAVSSNDKGVQHGPRAGPAPKVVPTSPPRNRQPDAPSLRDERHKRREQLREYRQGLWRQHLLFLAAKKRDAAAGNATSSTTTASLAVASHSHPNMEPEPEPEPKRQRKDHHQHPLPHHQHSGSIHPSIPTPYHHTGKEQRTDMWTARRPSTHSSESTGDDHRNIDDGHDMKAENGHGFFPDNTWESMDDVTQDDVLGPFLEPDDVSGACNGYWIPDPMESTPGDYSPGESLSSNAPALHPAALSVSLAGLPVGAVFGFQPRITLPITSSSSSPGSSEKGKGKPPPFPGAPLSARVLRSTEAKSQSSP